MKKISLIIISSLTILFFFSQTLLAEKIYKVGVVDLARVISAFSKDSPAVKELAEYWKETETRIDNISKEIAELEDKLYKAREAKDERMALDLEKRINDRKAYRAEYYNFRRTEFEKRYQDLSKSSSILQQVQRIIEFIAIKESYSLILLKTDSAIIYFSKDADITELVLEYLKR